MFSAPLLNKVCLTPMMASPVSLSSLRKVASLASPSLKVTLIFSAFSGSSISHRMSSSLALSAITTPDFDPAASKSALTLSLTSVRRVTVTNERALSCATFFKEENNFVYSSTPKGYAAMIVSTPVSSGLWGSSSDAVSVSSAISSSGGISSATGFSGSDTISGFCSGSGFSTLFARGNSRKKVRQATTPKTMAKPTVIIVLCKSLRLLTGRCLIFSRMKSVSE